MVRKTIKFTGLALMILFIAGLTINQVQITLAKRALLQRQASSQEAIMNAPASEIQENEVIDTPVQEIPETVDANNIEQTSIETTIDSSEMKEDQPLQNFLTLTKPFEAQFLQPGWFHYVFQVDRDSYDLGDPLPNGVVIPEDYLSDSWMLLDEEGFITKAINQMLTLDGQVIQTSVLENGVWTNLTLGDWVGEEVQETPSRAGLSFGFAQKIERAIGDGDLVTEKVEGDVTLFVITHVFEAPIQITNSTVVF